MAEVEYEVARRLRMEENQRRLKELGIDTAREELKREFRQNSVSNAGRALATARRQPSLTALPADGPRRTSSRAAALKRPNYADQQQSLFPLAKSPRTSRSHSSASWLTGRQVAPSEAQDEAWAAAVAFEGKLRGEGHRCLLKAMMPSNVAGGFWLGLNTAFCEQHMPRSISEVELENEVGKCWSSRYLPHKSGLSGGWKGFSIANKLCEGDALVFHLLPSPTASSPRIKVHIFRALDQPSAAHLKEQLA